MNIIREKTKNWSPEKKEKFFTLLTLARAKKRAILFEKTGGKCHYCQRQTRLPIQGQRNTGQGLATLDHIIPAVFNGTEHLSNFVLSCQPCNGSRNEMDYETYYKLRTTPGAWKKFKADRLKVRRARSLERNAARKIRRMERNGDSGIRIEPSVEELVSITVAPLYGQAKHNWDSALARYVGHDGINLLHNWINDAKWSITQA